MSLYTNYIKYNKNYWQRKLIDNPKNFGINLIKSNILTREESKNLFKKYVEIINLETSAYCNRVCPYCPVSIYERKDKTIKISELMSFCIWMDSSGLRINFFPSRCELKIAPFFSSIFTNLDKDII